MEVTYEVGSYNPRRYGKPWIAKITEWKIGGKPVHAFGASSTYTAEVDAEPGDVVRYGQKDLRKAYGGERCFGIVQADGSIVECSESEAKKHFRARQIA